MRAVAFITLAVVAGCGDSGGTDGGPGANDLAIAAPDLRTVATDLATDDGAATPIEAGAEMAIGADLAIDAAMILPTDGGGDGQAASADMTTMSADMAIAGADMTAAGADMTARADLTAASVDMTASADLTTVSADMTARADLTIAPPDMVTSGDDLGAMVTLHLENYASWCSVSVNGGTPGTIGDQMLMFPKGAKVTLNGDKKAGNTFVWGYWQIKGGAKSTNMSLMATLNADTTIQACCPFASDPNTPCPAP